MLGVGWQCFSEVSFETREYHASDTRRKLVCTSRARVSLARFSFTQQSRRPACVSARIHEYTRHLCGVFASREKFKSLLKTTRDRSFTARDFHYQHGQVENAHQHHLNMQRREGSQHPGKPDSPTVCALLARARSANEESLYKVSSLLLTIRRQKREELV